jgi:hypothetical protein
MSYFVDAALFGENTGDRFGSGLAMSGDGSRFIVGASNFNGTAGSFSGKIYSCSISGDNIVIDSSYEGQTGSESLGISVALNSAGNRYVACGYQTIRIGSVAGDGTLTPTYSGTHGLVEDGTNTYIFSCALNADGTILATTHASFDSSSGLTNDGQLRFYTIPSDGTNLTPDASAVGDINSFQPKSIALNDAGDRFIWAGNNTCILGTFNGSTITKSFTFTRTGLQGTSVALNAVGDRFVAGAKGLNSNYGGFYTGTFNGVSGEIDGSFTYQASEANVGDSIAISDAGDRFIVGGGNNVPSNDEGIILMGTISDVGIIVVDTSYAGPSADDFVGRLVASDSTATSFISSGASKSASTGIIYYVAPSPDDDGDGVTEPPDIFLNQQLNVVPTAIPQLANVFAIAPGKHHTLAITRDGRVLSFGRNQSGQLGRLLTDVSGHVPADVSGASNGYAAARAGARLEGGDAYARADEITRADKNMRLVAALRAMSSALDGTDGFNAELANHYLAVLGGKST